MASKQPQRPTICPECKTPQQGKEPFCEHCGFRLRSQETALEGVPAISPAQLKQNMLPAADLSRPRASTQEEPHAPVFSPPPSHAHPAPPCQPYLTVSSSSLIESLSRVFSLVLLTGMRPFCSCQKPTSTV